MNREWPHEKGGKDFRFGVEDVLEEYREAQLEFAEMQAPIDKVGEDLREVNAFHPESAK